MRPLLALLAERVIIDCAERPFLSRDVPFSPSVASHLVSSTSLTNDGNALVGFGQRASQYDQLL